MKFNSETLKDPDGEKIEIREINVKQRQEIIKLSSSDTDSLEIDAHLLKMGVTQYKDLTIDQIMEFPSSFFSKVAKKIMKLSALAGDEDAEKNS